jgi:flagellar basal-body rod protein FlgB
MRQKVVASNTPTPDTGIKPDVDFGSSLRSLLDGDSPHTAEVQDLALKNDGNNVSLDREARLLAENALRFNVASNLIKGQLRMLKEAIQEGKTS